MTTLLVQAIVAFWLLLFGAMAQNGLALEADTPMVCNQCDGWNQPHEPFRIFGNTYYVGVKGLSSVLIASDEGLILIDGGLAQSAPLIDANIRKLGAEVEQVETGRVGPAAQVLHGARDDEQRLEETGHLAALSGGEKDVHAEQPAGRTRRLPHGTRPECRTGCCRKPTKPSHVRG